MWIINEMALRKMPLSEMFEALTSVWTPVSFCLLSTLFPPTDLCLTSEWLWTFPQGNTYSGGTEGRSFFFVKGETKNIKKKKCTFLIRTPDALRLNLIQWISDSVDGTKWKTIIAHSTHTFIIAANGLTRMCLCIECICCLRSFYFDSDCAKTLKIRHDLATQIRTGDWGVGCYHFIKPISPLDAFWFGAFMGPCT